MALSKTPSIKAIGRPTVDDKLTELRTIAVEKFSNAAARRLSVFAARLGIYSAARLICRVIDDVRQPRNVSQVCQSLYARFRCGCEPKRTGAISRVMGGEPPPRILFPEGQRCCHMQSSPLLNNKPPSKGADATGMSLAEYDI